LKEETSFVDIENTGKICDHFGFDGMIKVVAEFQSLESELKKIAEQEILLDTIPDLEIPLIGKPKI
jgi:hypothetical protein